MNTQGADGLTGAAELRRPALERAFLGVQRERVALTETFMRPTFESKLARIDKLILCLLRLQQEVEVAQFLAFANRTAAASDRNRVPAKALLRM